MSVLSADLQILHFEHKVWMNELDFFAGELVFFENRLSDLVMRYREVEVLAKLEQFQNQFIRQKEVLDKLMRDIHVHEQKIGIKLQQNEDIQDTFLEIHNEMRTRMASYRKIYGELKTDFFQFLSKWV
ncbi:MAG: hypothetical protein ACKOAY_03215 [Haliscomenobacter sp.]